jgi:FMN phosphatase YigB (HAD superfamily)
LAAQTLKADPQKIVHIGDNLRIDVWGAKTAGFKAIHLSGNAGRDRIADSDPTSLLSLSRNLGVSRLKQVRPDKTVTSLSAVKEAIRELENSV